MKAKDKNKIIEWANTLTDEQLEKEYYDCLFHECLGSQCETMLDLGYDIEDIKEQDKWERYSCEKCDILEHLCLQRGIKLFE